MTDCDLHIERQFDRVQLHEWDNGILELDTTSTGIHTNNISLLVGFWASDRLVEVVVRDSFLPNCSTIYFCP